MTGFEPGSFGIGIDCSFNCGTTSALDLIFYKRGKIEHFDDNLFAA